MTAMAVPEATMDEDGGAKPGKDQIGPAGNMRGVKPVPESPRMQPAPDQHLWICILAPYAGHHPAAGLRIHDIRQPPALSPHQ